MKASQFAGKFLKAADIKVPQTITVAAVEASEFPGKEPEDEKERKLVLFYDEGPQGIVLNAVNLRTLIDLFGTEETDEWAGKRVQIFNDLSVSYRGSRGGIRFRPAP